MNATSSFYNNTMYTSCFDPLPFIHSCVERNVMNEESIPFLFNDEYCSYEYEFMLVSKVFMHRDTENS